jgi:hypothetical protein
MWKNLLGEEHPDVAYPLNNLGMLYENINDYIKAGSYLAEAHELFFKTLGNDHPNTKFVLKNLENVRKKLDEG